MKEKNTMPELPEMETYRKLLNKKLIGKTITDIEINREKSINISSIEFTQEIKGKQIIKIDRRAKHLIFCLNSGKKLLLHLMLGGWMYIGGANDNPNRTKQVILSFGNMKLYFIGLRLGYLHLLDEQALQQKLSDLGPEPLEPTFTFNHFQNILQSKHGKLKTTLINQKIISGIGNCYSDEICFEAKIKPTVTVDSLEKDSLFSIYNSIHTVLHNAISLGGYMDNPFSLDDQLTGGYNNHILVYDREGEKCRRCGGTIIKTELASRKCFYCPDCQNG
jgi:formamidopyrimidine-DNA glycosylase